jgi:hypothetical protein
LASGKFYWYGPDGWDFTVTDGTNVHTNYGHTAWSASDSRIVFPTYLTSISTTTYEDDETSTYGTDSDWVVQGGATADLLSFTPLSDNAVFRIGASGTTKNAHFQVYSGTGVGLLINPETPALTITGLTTSINASSNYDTNINTGTSTGAINIGSSTAGVITIDSTTTGTANFDGAFSLTTTDAGADITINSILGRVIIEGEEDATDAVIITADGGTSSTLTIFNDTGTGAASIGLLSDLGGITATASAGLIALNATGADAGDLTLSAGDVMTLTSVDTKIFDGATAETWIVEGTANAHETSVVFTDPTADVVYTFPTAGAMTVSVMSSTLATNAPDIANSVTGGTSTLIFEGSGVDAHEHTITATNPTADIVWTLPDAGAMTVSIMSSTLATNMPEVANSVTGGTNQLIFEGTANAFETILTATDATADATLTLPDDTGYLCYIAEAGASALTGAGAIPLTDAVCLWTTNAANAGTIANGEPGQIISIVVVTDGGEGTLTPATSTGWATAVFTSDIDTLSLLYVDDAIGWIVLGTASDGTQIVALTQ